MGLLILDSTGVFVAPVPVEVKTAVIDPVVIIGSVTVTPAVTTIRSMTVNPAVSTGGATIVIPVPVETGATTVNPNILVGGSLFVVPAPVVVRAVTVNPTVVLGSTAITPTAITIRAATINPTVTSAQVIAGMARRVLAIGSKTATNLEMRRNDLQPFLFIQVTGDRGDAIDLTGGTVIISMRNMLDGVLAINRQSAGVKFNGVAAGNDADDIVTGKFHYEFQAGETSAGGMYFIEFEVTPVGVGKFTVPSNKNLQIMIFSDEDAQ